MKLKTFYVYILTNKRNNVLYIGITGNIESRVWQHKNKVEKGFTNKYNITKLIYYEEYSTASQAIAREKQLKNWKREWKFELIKENNPNFIDLSMDWQES